jgi:hypothetical protein
MSTATRRCGDGENSAQQTFVLRFRQPIHATDDRLRALGAFVDAVAMAVFFNGDPCRQARKSD